MHVYDFLEWHLRHTARRSCWNRAEDGRRLWIERLVVCKSLEHDRTPRSERSQWLLLLPALLIAIEALLPSFWIRGYPLVCAE